MDCPLFRKAESSFRTELGFPGSSLAREEEGAGHPLASASSAGRSWSPGRCSPPASRAAPGSAHLCPPSPAAVQLASSSSAPVQGLTGGPRPVLSALHASLRGATEPGLGRHPRGCSHKDAARALAKLPAWSQAGEQTAEPEREPEAGVEGLWGAGRRGSRALRVRWGRAGRGRADGALRGLPRAHTPSRPPAWGLGGPGPAGGLPGAWGLPAGAEGVNRSARGEAGSGARAGLTHSLTPPAL